MSKIIGYRNTVAGDESTPLVPCYKLTEGEAFTQAAAKITRDNIAKLEAQLKLEKAALENNMKACQHHVHKEEAGFPYNQRWCVICGAYMGML